MLNSECGRGRGRRGWQDRAPFDIYEGREPHELGGIENGRGPCSRDCGAGYPLVERHLADRVRRRPVIRLWCCCMSRSCCRVETLRRSGDGVDDLLFSQTSSGWRQGSADRLGALATHTAPFCRTISRVSPSAHRCPPSAKAQRRQSFPSSPANTTTWLQTPSCCRSTKVASAPPLCALLSGPHRLPVDAPPASPLR